ncbi:MAG TPA: hypothetical protein VFD32_16140 [Dehalococcoidia bacterium]|nr:hypothetical protein [Dehalococcoidia bacterium]
MPDLFSGQLNHPAGVALFALNPFSGLLHDARTAIDRLVALQQPEGLRGRGDGTFVSTG